MSGQPSPVDGLRFLAEQPPGSLQEAIDQATARRALRLAEILTTHELIALVAVQAMDAQQRRY